MSDIYTEFQGIASDLIGEFAQGEVVLVQPGAKTGDAHNPTVWPPTEHAVDATVSGVPQKMIDGTLILASDLMVTIAGDVAVRPEPDWSIKIDGRPHAIVQIAAIPPAGVTVVYKIVVRS